VQEVEAVERRAGIHASTTGTTGSTSGTASGTVVVLVPSSTSSNW
jgi:hypothetical protein